MPWLQELDFETTDGIVRAWFMEFETMLEASRIEAEIRSHPEWQYPSTLIELSADGYLAAIQFELGRDRFKFIVRKSRRAQVVGHAMFQEDPEPAFRLAMRMAADLIVEDRLAVLEQ
jgi:hypothetical protein